MYQQTKAKIVLPFLKLKNVVEYWSFKKLRRFIRICLKTVVLKSFNKSYCSMKDKKCNCTDNNFESNRKMNNKEEDLKWIKCRLKYKKRFGKLYMFFIFFFFFFIAYSNVKSFTFFVICFRILQKNFSFLLFWKNDYCYCKKHSNCCIFFCV